MKSFTFSDALTKLKSIGEEHLLSRFHSYEFDRQMKLLKEIEGLDCETFKLQQSILKEHLRIKNEAKPKKIRPFRDFAIASSDMHKTLGKSLLAQGKVGCMIVAGGQGTRLSYEAPKGTFPVSVIKNKSLFQLFAEKTLSAGRQVGRSLPLAIMTSPQNDAVIKEFFKENRNFGLEEDRLFFYCQEELPFLDDRGHAILIDDSVIAKGPAGNGGSLRHFVQSGIHEAWKREGVSYVNYILVDNPLADPFDAELIGFHASNDCEITLKCVEKILPEERVGVVVDTESRIAIVEYSEMDTEERTERTEDGKLKHRCANTGLFCFSMDFIERAIGETRLPWHLTYKPVSLDGPQGWKFETFIFDYMSATRAIKALLFPRDRCFAPLKNASGPDSLETVREALLHDDLLTLESICGHPISSRPLELDQDFHYPTDELLKTWKNRKGPFKGYIEHSTSE